MPAFIRSVSFVAFLGFATSLFGQLPAARLDGIFPAGASPGATVEVTISGTNLDDVDRLVFSHEGITLTRKMAEALAERGAFALAALKGAFVARHGGVSGLSRVSHDLLLRLYLDTDESHELGEAFRGKRTPDAV